MTWQEAIGADLEARRDFEQYCAKRASEASSDCEVALEKDSPRMAQRHLARVQTFRMLWREFEKQEGYGAARHRATG